MKTLGLIGGTTWLSTVEYYKLINQQINERLGGLHSAKMFLYSLNFEEFKPSADPEKWQQITKTLSDIAKRLEAAGAECIVMCANTPHLVADTVQQSIHIPLIHIAEVTAKEVRKQLIKKVGLLGTKFTMEHNFFKDRLTQQQIETVIPDIDDREFIHDSILNELGKEIFSEDTKKKYLVIIDKLIKQGAQGIIFGCTEIPMLIKQSDCNVPVFDTTAIHASAAVDFALDNS
ncbi:MAG: aspartate/glutamate racemase family protein [Parafilimonas sp.]